MCCWTFNCRIHWTNQICRDAFFLSTTVAFQLCHTRKWFNWFIPLDSYVGITCIDYRFITDNIHVCIIYMIWLAIYYYACKLYHLSLNRNSLDFKYLALLMVHELQMRCIILGVILIGDKVDKSWIIKLYLIPLLIILKYLFLAW